MDPRTKCQEERLLVARNCVRASIQFGIFFFAYRPVHCCHRPGLRLVDASTINTSTSTDEDGCTPARNVMGVVISSMERERWWKRRENLTVSTTRCASAWIGIMKRSGFIPCENFVPLGTYEASVPPLEHAPRIPNRDKQQRCGTHAIYSCFRLHILKIALFP